MIESGRVYHSQNGKLMAANYSWLQQLITSNQLFKHDDYFLRVQVIRKGVCNSPIISISERTNIQIIYVATVGAVGQVVP